MNSGPILIPKPIEDAVHRMVANGESTEAIVASMRAMGLSKPYSMALLRDALPITLGEAKKIVHFSPTWDDRRASDEEFQEALYQTALKAGFTEVEEPLLERVG